MTVLKRLLDRALDCDTGGRQLHFLHIGKTGGSAIKSALSPQRHGRAARIRLHGHRVGLTDVPRGDGIVFFVRDPIDRFVSGFYSRLRCGRPRYQVPWDEAEQASFQRFRRPVDLARALLSRRTAVRRAAERAMRSIRHVNTSYWDWFVDEATLRSRLDDLVFIGRTEDLSQEFPRLRTLLGLPAWVTLPADDFRAHRTPTGLDRHLDPVARIALRQWYARDYRFVLLCGALRRQLRQADRGRASLLTG